VSSGRIFVHGNEPSVSIKEGEFIEQLVLVGGLVIIVLPIGSKVRGLKRGRGRWIFKDDKNLQHDFLQRGSKAGRPMS
jgi:hypothetical protein